jgi:hypothetical protein
MADVSADREVLGRVVDRLRSLPEQRLTRADDQLPGGSAASAVHELACWAAAASGVPDQVPVLHPLASGDQLAVVGRDLLDQAERGDGALLEQWRERIQVLRSRL